MENACWDIQFPRGDLAEFLDYLAVLVPTRLLGWEFVMLNMTGNARRFGLRRFGAWRFWFRWAENDLVVMFVAFSGLVVGMAAVVSVVFGRGEQHLVPRAEAGVASGAERGDSRQSGPCM